MLPLKPLLNLPVPLENWQITDRSLATTMSFRYLPISRLSNDGSPYLPKGHFEQIRFNQAAVLPARTGVDSGQVSLVTR